VRSVREQQIAGGVSALPGEQPEEHDRANQLVAFLLGAILAEQHDEWQAGKRYVSAASLAKLTAPREEEAPPLAIASEPLAAGIHNSTATTTRNSPLTISPT
jgi:hypothetical protein